MKFLLKLLFFCFLLNNLVLADCNEDIKLINKGPSPKNNHIIFDIKNTTKKTIILKSIELLDAEGNILWTRENSKSKNEIGEDYEISKKWNGKMKPKSEKRGFWVGGKGLKKKFFNGKKIEGDKTRIDLFKSHNVNCKY